MQRPIRTEVVVYQDLDGHYYYSGPDVFPKLYGPQASFDRAQLFDFAMGKLGPAPAGSDGTTETIDVRHPGVHCVARATVTPEGRLVVHL